MNYALTFMLLWSFCISLAFANPYQEDVQEALNQLQVSKDLLAGLDVQTLPNFEANPKEQSHLPSQQGELEKKGQQYVKDKEEGQYLDGVAHDNKEIKLDKENKDKGRADLENTLTEEVECLDGSCIKTPDEESVDFSEGAVQLGALNGVAEEVRDNQAPQGVAALFKARNITCRVAYRANPFNYCNPNNNSTGVSQEERELHKAQHEGRAVIAYPDRYCAKRKYRVCLQKRQSWCVFQSKLAKVIQVEARRQLGLNFGYVGGDSNNANCRGLTTNEVSAIAFDTQEMQQALKELATEFENKKRLPDPNQVARAVEEQVRNQQGGGYE